MFAHCVISCCVSGVNSRKHSYYNISPRYGARGYFIKPLTSIARSAFAADTHFKVLKSKGFTTNVPRKLPGLQPG
jgi:hypothetical protein